MLHAIDLRSMEDEYDLLLLPLLLIGFELFLAIWRLIIISAASFRSYFSASAIIELRTFLA